MSNKIEKNEAWAAPADIPDQVSQLALRQMVTQMHREGYVGTREHIMDGISLNAGYTRMIGNTWSQVDADDFG